MSLEPDPFPSTRRQGRSSGNRQGRRAFDQQTRSRVLKYIDEGKPLQQISDETGVSLPTIYLWREKASRLPLNSTLGLAWSHETRSRVSRFLARGVPVQEIVEKTGVPGSTVYV